MYSHQDTGNIDQRLGYPYNFTTPHNETDIHKVLGNQKIILKAEKQIIEMQNDLMENLHQILEKPTPSDKFLDAVLENNVEKAKKYLAAGANINYRRRCTTGLKIAICEANVKMVRLLLKNNVDIDDPLDVPWEASIKSCLDKKCTGTYQKSLRVYYLILRAYFKQSSHLKRIASHLTTLKNNSYKGAIVRKLMEVFFYECLIHDKLGKFKHAITGEYLPLTLDSNRLISYLHVIRQYHRVIMSNDTFTMLNTLFKENFITKQTFNEFTRILKHPKSYYGNAKKYPVWISAHLEKSENFKPAAIEDILSELQYHLGLLDEPGTNEILSRFKEGASCMTRTDRKNNYSLDQLQKFIDPDNQSNAISSMCMDEGVKQGVLQLTTHPDLSFLDKKRCLNLLIDYGKVSLLEKNKIALNKYTLAQIEKMYISQDEKVEALKLEINQLRQQLCPPQVEQPDNNKVKQPKQASRGGFLLFPEKKHGAMVGADTGAAFLVRRKSA